MTMKIASRMGRNPFEAKPTPKSATHILETLDEITAMAKEPSWIEKAMQLPARGVMLGLKSCLVVSYLVGHPEAWRPKVRFKSLKSMI
jgi:hypothetical protein